MSKIITCEQVSRGHVDKICDQISDAIVTDCLKHDRSSRVAVECLIKNNTVVIAGESTSKHEPDYAKLVTEVFERIGITDQYDKVIVHTRIGAGGVVIRSLTQPGTYVGVPVRRLEPRA